MKLTCQASPAITPNSAKVKPLPLELLVLEGQGRHQRHLVRGSRIELGRLDRGHQAGEGQVLFLEPTVSRLHALLEWDDRQRAYVLWHRSSTNPTLVNGKKVPRSQVIKPGDRIQMGNLLLETRIGVGQHADPEIDSVDVAQLVRSVRQEAGASAPRRIQVPPPIPRAPTPLPAFSLPDPPAPRPIPVESQPIRLVELERIEVEPEPLPPEAPEPEVEVAPPPEPGKARPYRRPHPKIGRNEKCPCGSGKKYKKCCLNS